MEKERGREGGRRGEKNERKYRHINKYLNKFDVEVDMRIAACELGGGDDRLSCALLPTHTHTEYISRLIHIHICTYIPNIIYGGGREGGRDHNLRHMQGFFLGGGEWGISNHSLCRSFSLSRGEEGKTERMMENTDTHN